MCSSIAAREYSAAALAVLLGACVTAPPPDLPPLPVRAPTILSELPPASTPITTWPPDGAFTFQAQVYDPSRPFFWEVFVDYDPVRNAGAPTAPTIFPQLGPTPSMGVSAVPFMLAPPTDPAPCPHRIELLVALSFNENYPHISDTYGADSVTWTYTPPGGCEYDAGALEEGAFDATDGTPIPAGGGEF
jgi:hypothetical protein